MTDGDRTTPAGRARDKDLVIRFKGGDGTAYTSIDRAYRPVAERICRRILINPLDAEDAIQETMLRVLTGLGRFNGQYRLEAWVARIATNVSLDIMRARTRRPAGISLEEDPENGAVKAGGTTISLPGHDDPSDVVAAREEQQQVRRLLRSLPVHHRTALVLREFEGASHEEIAASLGTSAPKVKALLHRAKRSFARAWDAGPARKIGALAFLPLAAAARAIASVRRVGGSADNAIPAAAGPVNTVAAAAANVAAAASSPAFASVASAGDRAVSNVAALALAGAVGMGAVVAAHPVPESPAPVVVAASPIEAPEVVIIDEIPMSSPDGIVASVAPGSPVAIVEAPPASDPPGSPQPSETVSEPPPPSGEPTPTPLESGPSTPSPSPSEPPTAAPTPSKSPEPAPAYSMGARTTVRADRTCDCSTTAVLESSRTSGTAGQNVHYSQSARGALMDGEGKAGWWTRISYAGQLGDGTGSMTFQVVVRVRTGEYVYRGTADVTSMSRRSDGVVTYRLAGAYSMSGGPTSDDSVPRTGTMIANLSWWSDGSTLYDAAFLMREG